MIKRRIYIASSWKNTIQPGIVTLVRKCGHDVYDFRHPSPGNDGFRWSDIDPGYEAWTPEQYREALKSPIAERGFNLDFDAMRWADTCMLVLPAGRSACFELGWSVGAGKQGVVIMLDEKERPDLMFRGLPILTSIDEVFDFLGYPA